MIFRTEHYRVLRLSGIDALAFLQSQLTNDVAALIIGAWQWQGYCSAKGRLLATFALGRTAVDAFEAVVPTSTIDALAKRLTMFRLRSKVSIEIAPDRAALLSMRGDTPDAGATKFALTDERAFVVVDAASAQALPQANDDVWNAWQLANINARIPEITAATTEMFVPQMIGWDTVSPGGGVSFSKGCYPGQEIVARAHYRGAVKRHLEIVSLAAATSAAQGAELTLPDGRVAEVCNAISTATNVVALVVVPENR